MATKIFMKLNRKEKFSILNFMWTYLAHDCFYVVSEVEADYGDVVSIRRIINFIVPLIRGHHFCIFLAEEKNCEQEGEKVSV